MGLRLGSSVSGALSCFNRAQYWRSRRGLATIALALLALYFLVIRSSDTPYNLASSDGRSRAGSSKIAGSFGGWRSWRVSWGPAASNHPPSREGWSGPASPLQTGLADFQHTTPHMSPGGGDPRLLDPTLFPSNAEEEERKKKEEELKKEAERKKKEEAERKKQKEEEDKRKAEAEKQKKKEEADAQRKKEEERNKTEAGQLKGGAEEGKKEQTSATRQGPTNPNGLTTTLVIGRKDEQVELDEWITDLLKDITHTKIYIVDDPTAPLHLNKNKGRESMVYLRYILDHYDDLDDVTLFYHSSRKAWHNNVLMSKDAAIMINNLNREWVVEKGYMNARCELFPGCPQWIKWNASAEETRVHFDRNSDLFSEELWDQLFPNRTHNPVFLSQPCCSQFAASREKIRSIPLQQYQIIHDWLATTGTFDGYTGRVMEYTWQFLFLGEDEHCPNMQECYCKGYGLCLNDDHLRQLKIYNGLRSEIDDTLDKLGRWNADKGCPELEKDSKAREECKADNPWLVPLNKIKGWKMSLEDSMPKQWGFTKP